MKRILFAVLLGSLAGGSLAGGAVLPTVKTAQVGDLGRVVVSASGRTLYHYTDEAKGKVDCTGGGGEPGDRERTRPNSRHRQNTYSRLCFAKKKKIHRFTS